MQGRSLSLQAYRTLARRGRAAPQDFATPRPEGDLVWIHLGDAGDFLAVADLILRLQDMREGLSALLTVRPDQFGLIETRKFPNDTILRNAPEDHPKSVPEFLAHWSPDLCLWTWGGLRPILVDETARLGIPIHLISAQSAGFDGRRDRWLPELSRHMMRSIGSATASTRQCANKLMKLGLASDRISIHPTLQPTGHPLRCEPADLDEASQHLAARQVWLAARSRASEWPAILAAHRQAMRGAHRLLLIIDVVEGEDLTHLTHLIEQQNLPHALWSDGDWPTETTQVLISDLPDDLGLWYRVATVSFLGNSLNSGCTGTNPMSAAALGSAILYGPNVRNHLDSYSRLAQAGAARIVNDAASLGSAVGQLIAPDHAASMAHAGWDVASEGAEVIDTVTELVQDGLDMLAAGRPSV